MKFLLFALGCLVLPAQANLLYYLPFATGYNPATLGEDGLVGQGVAGHGNFAATGNGADTDLLPGSLSYVDSQCNMLATTGGAALIDTNEETAAVSNVAPLKLTGANTPAGQTIWISLIGQQTAGTTARFFNLSLRAPDNTIVDPDTNTSPDEILALGMPSGASSQLWHIWDRSTGGVGWISAPSETPSTQKSFILARLDLNYEGDKERFTLWVNPRLDTAPEESAGFSFISTKSDFSNWSQLNEIRLAAGFTSAAGPSSAWQVDEIRIGDTREDVCPLVPFRITQVVRLPSGAVQVTWFAPPGCTDTVEWSSDLIHWQPYPASARTNPPASVTALWETPVSSETALFLRIRRAP